MSHGALVQSGLADRCVSVPVRKATDSDILLVHRSDMISRKTSHLVHEDEIIPDIIWPDVLF